MKENLIWENATYFYNILLKRNESKFRACSFTYLRRTLQRRLSKCVVFWSSWVLLSEEPSLIGWSFDAAQSNSMLHVEATFLLLHLQPFYIASLKLKLELDPLHLEMHWGLLERGCAIHNAARANYLLVLCRCAGPNVFCYRRVK